MKLWTAYSQLTKSGIILFSVVSALAGYAVSYNLGDQFEISIPFALIVGVYLTAAGGFALNQAQEWQADSRMNRTKNRPIVKGIFTPWQAAFLGVVLGFAGLLALLTVSLLTSGLALLTLVLYNGVYTLYWKRRWAFGAVPGAIPGAMPVVIGYSCNTPEIWRPECVYMFLVMFLWQMPHFWALAIRYREDYRAGGYPVLPLAVGVPRAMYHTGLYLFTYVGVALTSPFFLQTHYFYLLFVLPISLKVLWEFRRYFLSTDPRAWLPFFLWTNLSMLIYLAVPVMDKWVSLYV